MIRRRVLLPDRREWAALGTCLAVLGLLVLVLRPFRDELDSGTAALVLLAAPLVAAIGGLRTAAIAAVVSALAFNFWFTEPYGSLRIASDAGVAAFVTYLVLGVAFGVITQRLRSEVERGTQQVAEATLLRELTIDLVRQGVWLKPPVASSLAELRRALDLDGAALRLAIPGGEQFTITEGAAEVVERHLESVEVGEADRVRSLRPELGQIVVPITSGTTVFGLLGISSSRSTDDARIERTARLFANVVALACERTMLSAVAVEQQALEETDRLRTTLVQSITHDLRTPLASISATASALRAIGGLQPQHEELVAEIEQQSQQLARLVTQVLDLSRIEGGVLRPRLEQLALDDVVHSAVAAAGVDVDLVLEPGLPPVAIDEVLIERVLVNLLDNARTHGAPPFKLAARRRGDRVEIALVDHGRGVPEAERRRLFLPAHAMSRADPLERSRGLGLAVSAGFVAAHRGHLRVEPTPGGGSTFVISLPAASGGAS